MDNCIFCKIISGDIPSYKVYEDEHVVAFLDISQITSGHTLIVPKKHSNNLLESSSLELSKTMDAAKIVGNILLSKLDAKGLNIISNINQIAGQTIMHSHVHLIPRYNEDELVFTHSKKQIDHDCLRKVVDVLNK